MRGDEEGEQDGGQTLAEIEQKSQDAEALGAGASDVGRADIAAAGGADILLAKDAHEQVAEGDGPEQVSQREDGEPDSHLSLKFSPERLRVEGSAAADAGSRWRRNRVFHILTESAGGVLAAWER